MNHEHEITIGRRPLAPRAPIDDQPRWALRTRYDLDSRQMIEAAHPDLVRSLRAACAAGSTPSELIQQICDYFGMPADALQFQVILLMKTAFDLSLSEARGVLEAPAFGYRSVDELADFDDRFARVLGCPRRHSNAL